jgi:CRISPR system Cascade subunit CasB
MTGKKVGASERGRPADRAGLARLRRLSVMAALSEEPVLRLFRMLGLRDSARLDRVATLACILAHVRDDTQIRFGRQIGRARFGDADTAALKPLRFQRLLAASTEEEIATSFRRAVSLLGGKANVADLAAIILSFGNEKTKRRLIFDYYATGGEPDEPAAAAPPAN